MARRKPGIEIRRGNHLLFRGSQARRLNLEMSGCEAKHLNMLAVNTS